MELSLPARSWACGIAYAIGRINFLFDKAQTPHMRADALCRHFTILNLLHIRQMDPRWSLPSLLANNPLAWLIEINGMIVDARSLPRALQEEAFRQGVIPFIPEEDA